MSRMKDLLITCANYGFPLPSNDGAMRQIAAELDVPVADVMAALGSDDDVEAMRFEYAGLMPEESPTSFCAAWAELGCPDGSCADDVYDLSCTCGLPQDVIRGLISEAFAPATIAP